MAKNNRYSPISPTAAGIGLAVTGVAEMNPATAPFAVPLGTMTAGFLSGINLTDDEMTIKSKFDDAMDETWHQISVDYKLTDACLKELKQEVPGKNTSTNEFVDNLRRKNLEDSYAMVVQTILERHKNQLNVYSVNDWNKEFIENASKDIASRLINTLKSVFNEDDLIKILKVISDKSVDIRSDIGKSREADKTEHEQIIHLLKEMAEIISAQTQGALGASSSVAEQKNCDVIIFSPVNTDVYLEDKDHFILRIDRNSDFDYERNNIVLGQRFTLIFVGKSFEKKLSFERPSNNSFEFHLGAVLSKEEIESSYDREEAIEQIKVDATGYSFEQLSVVGNQEDIILLHDWLLSKSINVSAEDYGRNYLIAKCAVALGKLSIKYHSYEYARDISEVFDKYKAKASYGYYFEGIITSLSTAMNDDFVQEHLETIQKAEHGDAALQYYLGELYADKSSINKDHKKAFKWFLKSAENGYVKGMLRVAILYGIGLGCTLNYKKEKYWYRCAMEAGDSSAVLGLAIALDSSLAKTVDEQQEAIQLYEKASGLGYSEASRALAFYYMRDNRDPQKSFYWFGVGAEQGNSECQLYYAKALFYGNKTLGRPPKRKEAVMWYKKAADKKNVFAQYAYSRCLYYGYGIEKNESEAFKWCEKAAKQNMKWAQETLSIMYGRGIGIALDYNKSEFWYRTANSLESSDSFIKERLNYLETLTDSYPVFSSRFDW